MTVEWEDITSGQIASAIKGERISGIRGSVLTGISTDSRQIQPGQIFLALKGETYDGHDFIERAVERGASGIIAEKGRGFRVPSKKDIFIIEVTDTLRALGDLANWWRRRHEVVVACITGSAGKTTTKEMTAGILNLGSRTLKNKGNLNNLIGLPLTLLQLRHKDSRAVLEMGMNRPGEIGRLTEISEPDIGLITNVARAHLEGVGDIRGVARAKTELLERISWESQVVLHGDDEILMREASRFQRKTITYGLGVVNDVRASGIENLGGGGFSFNLQFRGECHPMKIHVPGDHNLLNALAASSIALCMGESYEHISKGLSNFNGIEGRFRPVTLPGDIILVDDTYNSNPLSLKAALDSIKGMAGNKRRVILGLGDMMELGDETESAHLEAGEMVAELGVTYFLAMGDHASEMLTGALNKGFPPHRTHESASHQDMAEKIRSVMKKGDLILLKGSRKVGLEKVSQTLKKIRPKESYNAQIKKNYGG